jgi:hypothetical protein
MKHNMSFINFPQFQVEKHDELSKRGYWYIKAYTSGPASGGSIGFVYRPLHHRAAFLALFMYTYSAIALLSILFIGSINSFARENEVIAIALWLVPTIAIGIFMLTKTYNASRKIHQEVNDDKRDNLYTSDQSLYTTLLEGTYICQACSTPIASTNDKKSVEKPYVTVSKLLDTSFVEPTNGLLTCNTCGVILGTYADNSYKLDGEKLALDAGELHLIYP